MTDRPNKAVPPSGVFGPGQCIWCGEHVTSEREAAGATNPDDECWAAGGCDYGCDSAPESGPDGCGGHCVRGDSTWRMIRSALLGEVENV